jgi:hypothetical protein
MVQDNLNGVLANVLYEVMRYDIEKMAILAIQQANRWKIVQK